MSDQRLIGVMDSGFGGIAVLKCAMEQLPNESFVFYGDNANAPYGAKDEETICRLSFDVVDKLMAKDVKCIVVACNTSTAAAIEAIRACVSPLPVVSMEPAIKPAIEYSAGEGKILMMATPATCERKRYQALKRGMDQYNQVIDIPCYGLVEAVEQRMIGKEPDMKALIEKNLQPYSKEEVRSLVMGCTHFTFAEDEIEAYAKEWFGSACRLFDGREGTVKQLKRVLQVQHLEAPAEAVQKLELFSSGPEKEIIPAMKAFLQQQG